MELHEAVRNMIETFRENILEDESIRATCIETILLQQECTREEVEVLFNIALADGTDKVDTMVEWHDKEAVVQIQGTGHRAALKNQVDVSQYIQEEYRNLLAKIHAATLNKELTPLELAQMEEKVPHTPRITTFLEDHGFKQPSQNLQSYIHQGGIMQENLLDALQGVEAGMPQTDLFNSANPDTKYGYNNGKQRSDAREALNELVGQGKVIKVNTQQGIRFYHSQYAAKRENSKHRRLYEAIVDVVALKGKPISIRAAVCEVMQHQNPGQNMVNIWKGPLNDLVRGGMVKKTQHTSGRCYYEV